MIACSAIRRFFKNRKINFIQSAENRSAKDYRKGICSEKSIKPKIALNSCYMRMSLLSHSGSWK